MRGFAGQTREQLRGQYREAWRKAQAGMILSPLEAQIAEVIALHPEYADIVSETDAGPREDNPFLHLGLHLAIREQIATDRPAGIRLIAQEMRALAGDAHRADHALMQVLQAQLWRAQQTGRAPDDVQYLQALRAALIR